MFKNIYQNSTAFVLVYNVIKYSPINQKTKVSEWTARLTFIIKLFTFKEMNHDTNTSRNTNSFKYINNTIQCRTK